MEYSINVASEDGNMRIHILLLPLTQSQRFVPLTNSEVIVSHKLHDSDLTGVEISLYVIIENFQCHLLRTRIVIYYWSKSPKYGNNVIGTSRCVKN